VACVLVHTEVDGGLPTDAARAILGEGRRIGSTLGAAVFAVAWVQPGDDDGEPARLLCEALGCGGADRVVLVPAPVEPTLWLTIGPTLATICDRLRPNLVILPAHGGGRDIAPRLAARLGGAFIAEPAIETGPRGEILLARPVYGGDLWRRVQLDELDQVAVITLSADRSPATGADEAELVRLALPAPSPGDFELIASRPDDASSLERARVIVVAGGGVTPAALPLVEALARALGAELGGTRGACERGHVPADREIGVGARQVTPDLYVACGASGSTAHLGAVSLDAEIVAIDLDARAPIFRAARWGLAGAIEDLVPALLRALEARP